MSQVFSGDAVYSGAGVTVTTTAETPIITGNFVNPPFQNAKAFVTGQVFLNPGAGTTGVQLHLFRNPNAENLLVAGAGPLSLTAGVFNPLILQAADVIPDGRPVQYRLSLQQVGATGNGNAAVASVMTLLISG